jgi:methylmalonyl-CoA/ethylmalonyl-CoA epimerase
LIEITHVDHVSMGAPDWVAQRDRLGRLLGFKFLHHFPARTEEDFEGCTMQVPGTDIEFEVISPAGPTNFVHRFVQERGPGLHHITVEVPDIHAAAAELKNLGIEPFGGVQDDGEWHVTYIHPRESGGILWQLFRSHAPDRNEDRTTEGGGAVGVKRMDHVSMATDNLDRQVEWQQRVFGFELLGTWQDDNLAYRGAIMRMPNSQAQFEIIQPTTPESFVQKFLDERGAGMHHICLEVESVERAAQALREHEIEPFGGVIDGDWKKHTFLHPRDSGGVLFQLFEEPDEA